MTTTVPLCTISYVAIFVQMIEIKVQMWSRHACVYYYLISWFYVVQIFTLTLSLTLIKNRCKFKRRFIGASFIIRSILPWCIVTMTTNFVYDIVHRWNNSHVCEKIELKITLIFSKIMKKNLTKKWISYQARYDEVNKFQVIGTQNKSWMPTVRITLKNEFIKGIQTWPQL